MTDLRAMVRDREAMHRRAQKAEALLPGLHHWLSAIVNVWKRNPNNENRLQAAFAEQGLEEIARHEADRYAALDPAAFDRAVAEAVERERERLAAEQEAAAAKWYMNAETRRGRHQKTAALARAAGHQSAAAATRKGDTP